MKSSITLFFLVLMLVPASIFAQSDEEIAIPLSNPNSPGKLKIGIIHGTIHVTGYDGEEVLVSYKSDDDDRRGRNDRSSRRGLRRIPNTSVGLEASELNNEVKVSVSGIPKDIDLFVRVPKNFSLKLSTVNSGDITVEDVVGEHEVSNVNGDIDMINVGGSAVVNTVNGDIDVIFSSVENGAPMAFTTVNGDIDLAVPSSTEFDVKIKSERGEIYTDFEFEAKRGDETPQSTRRSGQYRVTINQWVTGSINGGGAEYLFKTLHGDIVVRKN